MVYHLFVRVTILPGEMPEHDWHHLSPKKQQDWANGRFERQKEVDSGADYLEYWGLEEAIEQVFQGFAQNSLPLEATKTKQLDQS